LAIIVADHVYIVEENGIPHCYELTTGKAALTTGHHRDDLGLLSDGLLA